MTAPPAVAASQFGLPPPPHLSSLGGAAVTSTPSNTPAKPVETPVQPLPGWQSGPRGDSQRPPLGHPAAASPPRRPLPPDRPPPSPALPLPEPRRPLPDPPRGPRATPCSAARTTPPNERDSQAKYGHVAHDIGASIRSGGVVGGSAIAPPSTSGGPPSSGNGGAPPSGGNPYAPRGTLRRRTAGRATGAHSAEARCRRTRPLPRPRSSSRAWTAAAVSSDGLRKLFRDRTIEGTRIPLAFPSFS